MTDEPTKFIDSIQILPTLSLQTYEVPEELLKSVAEEIQAELERANDDTDRSN